jgi:pimeloyl-ACP methyl ester carboxylesterase
MNRRNAITVAALVVAVAASCDTTRNSGPEPTSSSATSALADVTGTVDVGGGRRIYVECRGEGSPTVVLISGKGNGADDWNQVLDPSDPVHDAPGDDLATGAGTLRRTDAAVLPAVARFARVCAYDRPDVRVGADTTTSRPQPHTVDQDVDDLHTLLTALDEAAPYVLVAHSYGGVIATLYARTHPDDIAGLVMVDPATELIADVVSPAALANWDAANAMTSDQVREGVHLIDAFAKIDAAPPMPDVPAVVLSADKPWRTDLLPPEAAQQAMVTFQDWLAALDRLASDLHADHITATDSGHAISLYNRPSSSTPSAPSSTTCAWRPRRRPAERGAQRLDAGRGGDAQVDHPLGMIVAGRRAQCPCTRRTPC